MSLSNRLAQGIKSSRVRSEVRRPIPLGAGLLGCIGERRGTESPPYHHPHFHYALGLSCVGVADLSFNLNRPESVKSWYRPLSALG